ncbi:MAG: 2,3-bisphosphoglycerate-dependent phosphoglycerate mutase [Geminicoccaceae bacterium]
MPLLIFMRHGTTLWAEKGLFAGWGDAPLSPTGEDQARKAGSLLKQKRIAFDICHTSKLGRAQRTLDIVLKELESPNIPIVSDWRLNERHYGMLQEKSRTAVAQHYGREAMVSWRRDYRAQPPALEDDDPRWQEQRQRFANIPETCMPRSESLQQGVLRIEPYWHEALAPTLRSNQRVLVVAHTCSIRGMVRILDDLSDDEAEAFRIPTALPIIYELDSSLRPIRSQRIVGDTMAWWRNFKIRYKPSSFFWR